MRPRTRLLGECTRPRARARCGRRARYRERERAKSRPVLTDERRSLLLAQPINRASATIFGAERPRHFPSTLSSSRRSSSERRTYVACLNYICDSSKLARARPSRRDGGGGSRASRRGARVAAALPSASERFERAPASHVARCRALANARSTSSARRPRATRRRRSRSRDDRLHSSSPRVRAPKTTVIRLARRTVIAVALSCTQPPNARVSIAATTGSRTWCNRCLRAILC